MYCLQPSNLFILLFACRSVLTDKLKGLFKQDKFVLGMIHLTGNDKMARVREEHDIFVKEGLDGVIVENLHGSVDEVRVALSALKKSPIPVGIRLNGVAPDVALQIAYGHNAAFVQLQHVAGKYVEAPEGIPDTYGPARQVFSKIPVIGGVHPEGFTPLPDSCLEQEVIVGKKRAEGIVVTGDKIGDETPMDRIVEFRQYLGKHPLIVGSGLTITNFYQRFLVADGGIVGSYCKVGGVLENPVDQGRVHTIVQAVAQFRANEALKMQEVLKNSEKETKLLSPTQ